MTEVGQKLSEQLKEEMKTLRTLRDELRVQAELGKLELRDGWNELEHRWAELEAKFKLIAEGAREDADEIAAAARRLADELRASYDNLKKRL